jgi:benzoylformate decarboxylase
VTVLVVDNRSYEVLKSGMAAYKGRSVAADRLIGMDLDEPAIDIPAVARGFGVAARLVSGAEDLRDALEQPRAEPQLIDVLVREG